MSEWKKVKLGEICERVTSGGTPKANVSSYYNPPTIPWLNTKEINYCRITKTENYISEEGFNNSSAKWIVQDSVIVAMYGNTAGKVAINKIPLTTNQACCNLAIDKQKADYEFVYYQLCTLYGKMVSLKIGAAQLNLNAQIIKNLDILLPPLSTQHHIATILSRYDSLIENYQKQIKLLEEAAQRLYKEWFVDLHFPGHKNTKIVDGVPKGWEKKKVREIGKVITGKTPSTSKKEYYGGQIPFITIPDMHTGIYPTSSQFLSDLGANSQSGKFIPANSLMVSCIGTAGLVCITKEECQTNQQINSLVLNDNSLLYYMYNTFLSLKEHLNNIGSNGATMTNVNKSKFESIEILIPNNSISNLYNKAVEQSFRGIKTLSSQICLLTEARDRLLPKLMSGDIKIESLK
jgi:type I restriction enzyme S subunit